MAVWHPRSTGETWYPAEASAQRLAESVDAEIAAAVGGGGPTIYYPMLTASTTNPGLGSNPSRIGWWYRVGPMIFGEARMTLGTSVNPGSGYYAMSLPVPADLTYHSASTGVGTGSAIGDGIFRDNSSVGSSVPGEIWLATATTVRMLVPAGRVDHSTPWTWSDGDAFALNFSYLAAP